MFNLGPNEPVLFQGFGTLRFEMGINGYRAEPFSLHALTLPGFRRRFFAGRRIAGNRLRRRCGLARMASWVFLDGLVVSKVVIPVGAT
ncbi:MAG: hypothetical protein H6970_05740 [Gammaproteobacteria bacterium]|nr:hypothetical protein [Gammaproteobacteria bacterium]